MPNIRTNTIENDTHVVYGIRLWNEDEYRYVGYTSVGIKLRSRYHMRASKRYQTPFYSWYQKYAGKVQIVMEVIEVGSDDLNLLRFREQFWIATYREQYRLGIRSKSLLNLRDGGDDIPSPTTEQREKWSGARSGEGNPMYGLKGPDHPSYGFKHDQAERSKRSLRLRGEGNAAARLTSELVKEIRLRYDRGDTGADLAREYGLSKAHVSNIVNKKAWKHVE